MFKAIVLICLLSTPRPECQVDTALRVIRVPEAPTQLGMCGFVGQAYLAESALGRLQADEYVKVLCRSTQIGVANLG